MRKVILGLLLTLCLVFPSFATTNISCDVDDNTVKITVQGEENKPVTITISDENRKYYIDQGNTDSSGNIVFNVTLEEGKTYNCSVNIGNDITSKTITIEDDDSTGPIIPQEDTVYIKIKGYKGTILGKTEVEIEEGDTVLDVLKRVLRENNIDYSISGGYVKSIDGQAQFDKGSKSGWMFEINGEFPEIGAGSVEVNDGDYIKWLYTTDLGEDIGNKYDSSDTDMEEEIENKIEEIEDILNDDELNETEIKEAVNDIADEFNDYSDEIDSEEDAKDFVKGIKNVSKIIDMAAEKIETEEGAKDIAKNSIEIINLLVEAAEKIEDNEDKNEVSKAAADNMEVTLKIIDKITDVEEINNLTEDMIDTSVKLIEELGEENAKEIKEKVVEVAEKAVDKASTKEIEEDNLIVEKEKVIAKADENIIEEIIKNATNTLELVKEKLEENDLEALEKLQNKVIIKVPKLNKDEIETKLPSNIMKTLKEKEIEKVKVETEIASFNITPKTFGEKAEGKEISLNEKKVDRDELTEAQKKIVPENSIVVDLDSKLGEEKVSSFDDPIEISIPYEAEVEEGKTVKVFFLGDDGSIESMEGTYDPETKLVTFKTSHFSKFFAKKIDEVVFKDLMGYQWAEEAIGEMANKGIVNGRGEGIFDPSANITRAEFVAIVTKMIGYDEVEKSIPFEDVEREAWYYDSVTKAYKNGLISGKDKTTFDPKGNITRQEMAVIVAKILEEKGYKKVGLEELNIFNDKEVIDGWAKDSVSLCVKEGIISGMGDGRFAPKENANRAQAVVMLYRLHQLIED